MSSRVAAGAAVKAVGVVVLATESGQSSCMPER